ncbi:MAG: acetyl-CoA carboxylase biotin carboxyl carrier protein subunit [Crocinitomicaceae bacterium]|nr:acetyl-CoA carboxylase biotin carboxyl carrier protein subunit [Crocinitomicaceae bacterium]|tara:strand:+ start:994 stop:1500 length:507 start_codon:yes stop_codon:yes gene_type:complete
MYSVKGKDKAFEVEFLDASGNKGTINGTDFDLDMIEVRDGAFHLIYDNRSYNLEVVASNPKEKTFDIKVNNGLYTLEVKDKFDLLLEQLGLEDLATVKISEVKAPMPGLVLNILVEPGQEVASGDSLLVLEAMKMENTIKSPAEGVVKAITVETGVAVEKNQVLIEFE